ncbi:hypothetical protein [Bacteroides sp. 224]|uniref:hypothetical protein n=1 Tax=Bacteroides sp. 224 TaxID=2302936 RepID=UPI0013D45AD6|nr:hypothetical protein [Bacteroides sp. 224]NDV64456.1 hypothetical protein [Bacteroides sp. 224]
MVQFISKHKLAITLLIAFLYQLLCIIQGFDLSDEGWLMYFCQQIFKNPECVEAQMPYWFTGIIGGAWYELWPGGGFFFMRFLGISINTLMAYLIYTFLKRFIDNPLLLLGLLVQVVVVAGDPKPFGYNPLSAFLVIFVIILFFSGMEQKKLSHLFLGGIILGLNFFVRLPNISYLVFILLIPIYHYIKYNKIVIINKEMLISILGVLTAVLICIVSMKSLGHWNLYLNSLTDTIASASDETNSHQLGAMLLVYLKNYKGIFLVGLFFIGIGVFYSYSTNKIKSIYYKRIIQIILLFFISYLSIMLNKALRHNDMYFVNFISLLGIILLFINRKKESYRLKFIGLASLFMVLFISIGSDKGIKTMWTSTWLSLPFATAYIYKCIRGFKFKIRNTEVLVSRKSIIEYSLIVSIVYFVTGIYKVDYQAYYDPGSRCEKLYAIDNKFTRLVYTNEYRAKITNELLEKLPEYIKPNDYLLAYDFIPGINYMTDTRSYTPNSWIWCYSGHKFEYELKKAVIQKKELPVIVRQHFIATNRWGDYDKNFYNENRIETGYFKKKRTQVINSFILENKYISVWNNKNYEILIPSKK